MEKKNRYELLDILRGVAVVCMVVYHIIYDLRFFKFISWKVGAGSKIQWLAYVTVFLFLFCMGTALRIAHTPEVRWKKWAKRSLQLALFAGAVSLATYLMLPKRWVYFGILHCVFLCNVVGILFVKTPRISLVLAVIMFVWHHWGGGMVWWKLAPSIDYIPFLPWFAVTLLGIASTSTKWYEKRMIWLENHSSGLLIRSLKWMGGRSLWIYLIHQPVLFGLMMGIKELLY